jgi:hypothetical protein
MLPRTLPVYVSLSREDGSVAQVQVGHAIQSDEGIVLHLHRLTLGASAPAVLPVGDRPSLADPTASTTIDELEYLAERSRRVLADPKKARWHAEQRALLGEIVAELDRKRERLAKAG